MRPCYPPVTEVECRELQEGRAGLVATARKGQVLPNTPLHVSQVHNGRGWLGGGSMWPHSGSFSGQVARFFKNRATPIFRPRKLLILLGRSEGQVARSGLSVCQTGHPKNGVNSFVRRCLQTVALLALSCIHT